MNCMNCGRALGAGLKFCPACGTPAPEQAPPFGAPSQGEQARTSWGAGPAAAPPRRKSRAGKILLIVFGVLLVLGVGAGFAVYYGVRHFANSVKSSEAYLVAEKELRENPVAKATLGEIENIGFAVGSTFGTEADGSSRAAYTMSVDGSRASGRYVVLLERERNVWRVAEAALHMPEGHVVNLKGGEGVEGPSANADAGGGPPPPPPAPGAPQLVQVPGAIEVGALDDEALSKPEPTYPSLARAARATGTVVVRVTLDEGGRVIMASAASGHPLLRAAAEAAARRATFAPTLKGGKPVKAVGTLTYKFE